MAVPGYTSFNGLYWLRRDISSLDPDLIIINFGHNDADLVPIEYKVALPSDWLYVTARLLKSKSQAAIYLGNFLKNY